MLLRLKPEVAPETVKYVVKCVESGLYNGREFYRSDFVIQCGLHGSGVANPHGDLKVCSCRIRPHQFSRLVTVPVGHTISYQR